MPEPRVRPNLWDGEIETLPGYPMFVLSRTDGNYAMTCEDDTAGVYLRAQPGPVGYMVHFGENAKRLYPHAAEQINSKTFDTAQAAACAVLLAGVPPFVR